MKVTQMPRLLSWYPTMLSSLCNLFEGRVPVDEIDQPRPHPLNGRFNTRHAQWLLATFQEDTENFPQKQNNKPYLEDRTN